MHWVLDFKQIANTKCLKSQFLGMLFFLLVFRQVSCFCGTSRSRLGTSDYGVYQNLLAILVVSWRHYYHMLPLSASGDIP